MLGGFMNKKISTKLIFVFLVFFLAVNLCFGQEFSLDDDPTNPLMGPPFPPCSTAEDPFGFGLPPVPAGYIGPSPSLLHWNGPFFDSEILFAGPMSSFLIPPPINYVDSISNNHAPMTMDTTPRVRIRFSVDRVTGGFTPAGTGIESGFNQQCGDIYNSYLDFAHPGLFAGYPPPPQPFGGVIGMAWSLGGNILYIDESALGLTAGMGVGVTTPPGVMCPPYAPPGGTHDNIDAYNDYGRPLMRGDVYFTFAPADFPPLGFSPADIFAFPRGAPGFMPPPYAKANMMGLDMYGGPNSDSIDSLVVWDYVGVMVCDPGIDYCLFTLSPGSATLTYLQGLGLPADGGTIFVSDYQGGFYVYMFSFGIGLIDMPQFSGITPSLVNVDAMEVCKK
jgi:hypothetical protein